MFPFLTSTCETENSSPWKDPNGPVKAHPPLDGVRGGALVKSSTCRISVFVL